MNRVTKRIALLGIMLPLVAGGVFGQSLMPKRIYTLTITVNAPDAEIWVDNEPVQGNQAKVTGGMHDVRVAARGFLEFVGSVEVKSNNQVFSVKLKQEPPRPRPPQQEPPRPQPPMVRLSIHVNVPNAMIMIDGVQIPSGPAATITLGTHSLRVTANGFQEYTTTLNVTSPMSLDVDLQPLGFPLSISANVAGAMVAINDSPRGPAPWTENLPRGSYTIRVSAPGFVEHRATVMLDRPLTITVQLKPVPVPASTLSIVLPPEFLARESHEPIKVLIDGKPASTTHGFDRIHVSPGRHSVRVSSGALAVQLDDLYVQPGSSYVLELTMGLSARERRSRPDDHDDDR